VWSIVGTKANENLSATTFAGTLQYYMSTFAKPLLARWSAWISRRIR